MVLNRALALCLASSGCAVATPWTTALFEAQKRSQPVKGDVLWWSSLASMHPFAEVFAKASAAPIPAPGRHLVDARGPVSAQYVKQYVHTHVIHFLFMYTHARPDMNTQPWPDLTWSLAAPGTWGGTIGCFLLAAWSV